MTLEDLGYSPELQQYREQMNYQDFRVGRVISEHKERYLVRDAAQEYESEILGNLRFSAQSRSDFPAVGDWVAFTEYDEGKGIIHAVFPRKSVLERQAVGKKGEKQLIATNIDFAFLVVAVDRDFSVNRLERYLTLCHAGKVQPLIVLNKIDLLAEDELPDLLKLIQQRISAVPVFPISNATLEGMEALQEVLEPGKTYCLLGSSGVGKSSLLNSLSGESTMKTGAISESTQRGKHVTTHRELRVVTQGALLIDNPGMREVGMTELGDGLETTFDRIADLAGQCRYADCTHTSEAGCAVLGAVESGELEPAEYENYLRMEREKSHFESTLAEKRQKDKNFGKMLKNYKKNKK